MNLKNMLKFILHYFTVKNHSPKFSDNAPTNFCQKIARPENDSQKEAYKDFFPANLITLYYKDV